MKNTTRIGTVLAITFAFFIAEIIVGFKTKSLALIADAFHYFNDVVAYVIAFAAAYLQDCGEHTSKFTFAFHRAELVGAFFNGVFLLALALSIFLQSLERFVHIEIIEEPLLVLIIGCVGLVLNTISALVIHDHHHHHQHGHLNPMIALESNTTENSTRGNIHASHHHTVDPPVAPRHRNLGLLGVLIHVVGDALNNIGVVIAAIIMWKAEPTNTKRFYADPAASLLISFIIFAGATPLTLKSARILLEGTPLYLDLAKVKEDLLSVPNVLAIHDFHIWHLSQSVILASLHVCIPAGTSLEEWEETEQTLQHCFMAYGIGHVTISPELQQFEARSLSGSSVLNGITVPLMGCKRLSSEDEFGCAVSELKKKLNGVA